MQLFIDSANPAEIAEVVSLGIIDGVTTNPSLLAKYGKNIASTIASIGQIVSGPVSVEVSAITYDKMLIEAEKILDFSANMVLKLPITWDGLKACEYFSSRGIKVNMTLCFSANQALIAAKAGAWCVSPFIGRLDDVGHNGIEIIKEIRTIYNNYPNLTTAILAASIRNPQHFLMSAIAGADIATLPAALIKQLITHPLTDVGLKIFTEDWEKSGLEI